MSEPSASVPDRPRPQPAPRWQSVLRKVLALGAWIVLAATLVAWAVVRAGDLWPPATVGTFGPLWFLLLPPVALLPAAAVFRRRSLWPLVPALLVAVGPVTGFCVPSDRVWAEPPARLRVRVLTCNLHYAKVDPAPLDRFVDEAAPDVVLLQERHSAARSDALSSPGWHVHQEPGLYLASRHPIRRAERLGAHSMGERGSVMRYELDTPAGPVTVFNLHLASPREGLAELARGDLRGIHEVATNSGLRRVQSRHLAEEAARVTGPVVLAGDFNTPPQSALFRESWGRYADAFADAGCGWGFTFFARPTAVRIDHILVGGGGRAVRCWVGPNVGSPHRPVVADVGW